MNLRFDTRDKKPKLRGLQAVTAAAALAAGILLLAGGDRAAAAISGPDRRKAAAFAADQCPNVHIIKELPSEASGRRAAALPGLPHRE